MSPELRYSIITVTGPLLSTESVLYRSPIAVGNGSPVSDMGNRKSRVYCRDCKRQWTGWEEGYKRITPIAVRRVESSKYNGVGNKL